MTPHLPFSAGCAWLLAAHLAGSALANPVQQQLMQRLQQMDADGDQRLSYQEIADGFQANKPQMKTRFKKADKNGNGVIDRDELPPLWFNKLDLDNNGSVPFEEYLVARTAKAREFVAEADRNRDGTITIEEFNRGVQTAVADAGATYDEMADAYSQRGPRRNELFRGLDVDNSGSIAPAEWPDANSFSAVDTDRDGAISRSEFMSAHYHITKNLVAASDLNRDGRVTVAEIQEALRRHVAARGQR